MRSIRSRKNPTTRKVLCEYLGDNLMMKNSKASGYGVIGAVVIVSVAIASYFTGLQSPGRSQAGSQNGVLSSTLAEGSHSANDLISPDAKSTIATKQVKSSVIPATIYSQLASAIRSARDQHRTDLTTLSKYTVLGAQAAVTMEDKLAALAKRQENRAFNGAPPTVPHPIDQVSAQACLACHGEGWQASGMRASRMSHQFLAECTQCHVESQPSHQMASLFRQSNFVGLPAPTQGSRAYPGAPPQVPHTTWMRSDCQSCHGPSGPLGLRTTHPWRQECQQCHLPTSTSDQIKIDAIPGFLEPPKVID
jgi:cytochrome c-type protein NapB